MSRQKGKVVFSTKIGDRRKQPPASNYPRASLAPAQQNLKIMRDKKGRKGKMVTVISGFTLTETDLKELAKTLKTFCGSGGTIKSSNNGGVIEVQGDHREKIAEKLQALGYKVKLAGG
ncbi:MAG: translation initiation factor [Anaerolineae bacterium]|nr:translation initiation factor [Anaerolineae bacterium]